MKLGIAFFAIRLVFLSVGALHADPLPADGPTANTVTRMRFSHGSAVIDFAGDTVNGNRFTPGVFSRPTSPPDADAVCWNPLRTGLARITDPSGRRAATYAAELFNLYSGVLHCLYPCLPPDLLQQLAQCHNPLQTILPDPNTINSTDCSAQVERTANARHQWVPDWQRNEAGQCRIASLHEDSIAFFKGLNLIFMIDRSPSFRAISRQLRNELTARLVSIASTLPFPIRLIFTDQTLSVSDDSFEIYDVVNGSSRRLNSAPLVRSRRMMGSSQSDSIERPTEALRRKIEFLKDRGLIQTSHDVAGYLVTDETDLSGRWFHTSFGDYAASLQALVEGDLRVYATSNPPSAGTDPERTDPDFLPGLTQLLGGGMLPFPGSNPGPWVMEIYRNIHEAYDLTTPKSLLLPNPADQILEVRVGSHPLPTSNFQLSADGRNVVLRLPEGFTLPELRQITIRSLKWDRN